MGAGQGKVAERRERSECCSRYCSRRPVGGASWVYLNYATLRIAKRLKTSPTGRRLQLCAIDEHDLPGIRPVIGFRYQTSANRILPDVIPFVCVAFIIAENMIEKAALPDRQRACWRNLFRKSLFQHSNPTSESENRPVCGRKSARDRA